MKKIIYIILLIVFKGYSAYSLDCNFKIYNVNYTGDTLYIDVDGETWNKKQMTNWDFVIYFNGTDLYIKPNFVSADDANMVNYDGGSNLPANNLNDISCDLWLPGRTSSTLLNTTDFPAGVTKYGIFWTTRGGWADDKIHQGWIEIVRNPDNTFTLLSYGYSINPNTSIMVGTNFCNPCSQEVITNSASSIAATAATLSGFVIGKGTAVNTITFDYGTTISYGSSIDGNPVSTTGGSSEKITANISGLQALTAYHYRINAINNVGTLVHGLDNTFTTLDKSSQTITFGPISAKNYGDINFNPGASTSSGLAISYSSSNAAVADIISNEVHIIAPGTTTIYADQAGDASNFPAPQKSQSLTVNTKTLTVTGAIASNKVYDGITTATISGSTLSGIVGTDLVTLANANSGTFASAAVNTDIAVTTAMTIAGTAANKYTLTQPALKANITKKTLTITANDKSKTYGDANPLLTVTYTGFAGTESSASLTTTPSVSTIATQFSEVNTYSIIPAGAEATNYAFSYVNGTFTVNKAQLDVTADNISRVKGQPNPTFTLSYAGFKGTDGASIINVQPTIYCIADASSNIGDYDIVLANGSDNNYNLILHNGKLTITPLTAILISKSGAISVFPNPANDYISISNIPEKTTIRIFNLQGVPVKDIISSNPKDKLDVKDLPLGIYIIKLSGKEFETTIHFVKH